MWFRVSNLEEALAQAEQLRATGRAGWFRGQTRPWPMTSSLTRRSPSERRAAIERLGSFLSWIQSVPELADLAQSEDSALAVAQHYGLATNLVDFSTEPKVAAFFSAHDPPPSENEDVSCIICLDYDELKDVCESARTARPDMPVPRAITVDIPELWRIQAQRGVFLEYPFDAGFERHIFGFDRILFPTEKNPAALARLIPLEDIYPTQKSDLEVLLDRFFMLERLSDGSRAMRQMVGEGVAFAIHQTSLSDGIEAECFGPAGLPVHESWDPSGLTDWLRPETEKWGPISSAPLVGIRYPSDGECREKMAVMRKQILEVLAGHPTLRTGSVRWTLTGVPGDAKRIGRMAELLWDGLRRWPYESSEIAQALATVINYGVLVDQNPTARHEPSRAQALAERCFGEVLEVEVGMEDGSHSRGYANRDLMRQAVRDDFHSFLTERWRSQIEDIRHVFQIASNPKRALVFGRLKGLFSTQIAPTQVVLRDEASGKARIYNPARATSLGLP